MKYYKFTKDKDHYKSGEVISTEKENKLLKQWIEEKIVETTTKPKPKAVKK